LPRRHLDPALADAVLLHVEALLVIEADADAVLEHGRNVMRAARIDREAIGQRRSGSGLGHGRIVVVGARGDDRFT
jgi:hypothetical protein